jgi:hypothetical protein
MDSMDGYEADRQMLLTMMQKMLDDGDWQE